MTGGEVKPLPYYTREHPMRTKRTNKKPPLKLQDLPVQNINLRQGEESLLCPGCNKWRMIVGLQSPMIRPHRVAGQQNPKPSPNATRKDRGPREEACADSKRHIDMSGIDRQQWLKEQQAADSTASGRRSEHIARKPRPQAPAPVAHMSSATRAAREELARHAQTNCIRCRDGHCGTVAELRIRIRRLTNAPAPGPLYAQLRKALLDHRAACTQCSDVRPCERARPLADRVAVLVQAQMRRSRPELYRTRA